MVSLLIQYTPINVKTDLMLRIKLPKRRYIVFGNTIFRLVFETFSKVLRDIIHYVCVYVFSHVSTAKVGRHTVPFSWFSREKTFTIIFVQI